LVVSDITMTAGRMATVLFCGKSRGCAGGNLG
jgi:hypothetical protein